MTCGCNKQLNTLNTPVLNNTLLNIQTLQVKTLDELVDLFRQGYTLDSSSNIRYVNGGGIVTLNNGTGLVAVTAYGIVLFILILLIQSLVYYKLGKFTAKTIGWD